MALELINIDEAIDIAFTAMEADRLALLCGAGLSIPPPSRVPSAQVLADKAKERYDSTFGAARAPLSSDIEEQASFFWNRGELATYYLRKLIDQHEFAGEPNDGHYAVADFLLTKGLELALSTNVDTLIETASNRLWGHIETAISREEAAIADNETGLLFKLHGCWLKERGNTFWTASQLDAEPMQSRIQDGSEWLANRLLGKDLVVVGYFTHWEHLSGALEIALSKVQPTRLLIVDPAETDWLQHKAPDFYGVGDRAAERFCHLRMGGEEFLRLFREAFSKSYIRQVLRHGRQPFVETRGEEPSADWLEPPNCSNRTLWRIRRDLEGCLPGRPSVQKRPPNEPIIGLMLLKLLAAGATWDGNRMCLADRNIRVLRGSQQPLHKVRAMFQSDSPPLAPEAFIAIGAVDLELKPNVARGSAHSHIVRGSGVEWYTSETADHALGLQ